MTNWDNFDYEIKGIKIIKSLSKWVYQESGWLVLSKEGFYYSDEIKPTKNFLVLRTLNVYSFNFVVLNVKYDSFKNDDERSNFISDLLDLDELDRNTLTALMILQSRQLKQKEGTDSLLALSYQGLNSPNYYDSSAKHMINDYLMIARAYKNNPWNLIATFKDLEFSEDEKYILPSQLSDKPLLKQEGNYISLTSNLIHKVDDNYIFLVLINRAYVVEFVYVNDRWKAIFYSGKEWEQNPNQDKNILETELLPAIVRNQGTYNNLITLLKITGWTEIK